MPENWKTYKLGDVATLQRGFDLPSRKRIEGIYPIIAASGFTAWHNEYKVKGPGVTTGRSGTLGKVFYEESNYWPLNTSLWVKDFHGNYPRFIYYFLQTLNFSEFNSGTSVPTLNRNDVHSLDVEIPKINEQRAIASILSALDDKIENNLTMNKTLEDMAMALYKHWFIDFGPFQDGKFIDSELGLIPEGWEVKKLGDFCYNKQYGYTESSSKEEIGPKFLRITDIQGGTINWADVPYCPIKKKDFEKYRIKSGDIFVARTGNSTGENTYVVNPPEAVFASYLIRFQFDNIIQSCFVAKVLRSSRFFDFVDGAKSGSAQPGISATVLAELLLIIPPNHVIQEFYSLANEKDVLKEFNLEENQTLTKLRDTLLPKLISGEVRVKDVEKLVSETL